MRRAAKQSGFTLIEVTLALMVMALGIFAVMHLFPSGLRASIDANAHTRMAQFSADVLETMRMEAAEDWVGMKALAAIQLADGTDVTVTRDAAAEWSEPVKYPNVEAASQSIEEHIRYKVELDTAPEPAALSNRVAVTVLARYGKTGSMQAEFYSEIYRFGM